MRRTQKQLPSESKERSIPNGYRHSNVIRMEIDGMAGMGRSNGPGMGITLDMDGFQQGTSLKNGKLRQPVGSYIVLSHRQARWLRDRISEIIG